jgi:hypothetical protein
MATSQPGPPARRSTAAHSTKQRRNKRLGELYKNSHVLGGFIAELVKTVLVLKSEVAKYIIMAGRDKIFIKLLLFSK